MAIEEMLDSELRRLRLLVVRVGFLRAAAGFFAWGHDFAMKKKTTRLCLCVYS